ncbi:MAG: ribosome-associated protein [Pseudohongiellaceae bacterium]|jgi:ribosome-associated protein
MSIENEDNIISKSQRKREADAMQVLGKRLTELTNAQLNELPLSEEAFDVIHEYNRLPNSHGAKRRQLQFIGRVMRDSDVEAITKKLDRVLSSNYQSDKNQKKKAIAQQAIDVLENGDDGINRVLAKNPQLDRQQLRQIHREFLRANDAKKRVLQIRIQDLLRLS